MSSTALLPYPYQEMLQSKGEPPHTTRKAQTSNTTNSSNRAPKSQNNSNRIHPHANLKRYANDTLTPTTTNMLEGPAPVGRPSMSLCGGRGEGVASWDQDGDGLWVSFT